MLKSLQVQQFHLQRFGGDFMEQISTLLKDITRQGRRYREGLLAPLGISPRLVMYLREIDAEPGISQERLSRYLYVNKSNVARNVADMEEEGYIQRRVCGKDRRILRLYLTEKAQQIMPQINEVMDSWEQLLVEGMSPEDQQTLERLMRQMRSSVLDALEEETP